MFFIRKLNINYTKIGKQNSEQDIHFVPSKIITVNNCVCSYISFLFIFIFYRFVGFILLRL